MYDQFQLCKDIKRVGYPNSLLLKYNFVTFTDKDINEERINVYLGLIECSNIEQQILLARYKEGKTLKEIGYQFGLLPHQVSYRLEKISGKLMRILKNNGELTDR